MFGHASAKEPYGNEWREEEIPMGLAVDLRPLIRTSRSRVDEKKAFWCMFQDRTRRITDLEKIQGHKKR